MRLVYKFGQGRGFGAEMMEILWLSYRCRLLGIDFVEQTDPYPRGVSIDRGWQDYFVRVFPTTHLDGPVARLNRHMYSRLGQLGLRPIARRLLDRRLRSKNLYIFDHGELQHRAAERQREAESGEAGLPTIRNHSEGIYRFRDEVLANLATTEPNTTPYIAVHIRRGDKITEAAYADLDLYKRAIERIPDWRSKPFYVLSDSRKAIDDFITLIRPAEIIGSTPDAGAGYDQKSFNALPPADRCRETLRIISDLEIARHSEHFVGTATSNVFWLMRIIHRRGGAALLDVHKAG
jgi:hypothetical protein